MIILFGITVALDILLSGYIVIKSYRYKIQIGKVIQLLLYNIAQFIIAYMFFDISQKIHNTKFIIVYGLVTVLIILSLVPLKIIFDSMLEKISVDEEYEFLMRKEESDKKYFALMGKYQDELSKIRHDFANQVELAYGAIRDSENEEAGKRLLDELSKQIQDTKTVVYCSSKTANMLISIAKEKCKKRDIDLEVEVLTSGILTLDEGQFCSIIKTMMDEILFLNDLKKTTGGNAKLGVKQEDTKMIFFMKCSVEGIETVKKIDKLISSCEKYFLQTIKKNCNFYSRKKDDFVEMILVYHS